MLLFSHTNASVSERPRRLTPVSAVMGGQGGERDVTTSKFEKGIRKIRWNQLLLLTPVAPHDKTLMSNHSDHSRGDRLKLVPICGRLYGFSVLPKRWPCWNHFIALRMENRFFTKEQMRFLFFFWWCFFGVDLIQVYVFFFWELMSQLSYSSVPGPTLRGWFKLLTKWFVKTLFFAFSEKNWHHPLRSLTKDGRNEERERGW